MIDRTTVAAFPGAEIVLPGLDDLAAGRLSAAACLVSIARPLMETSGLTSGFAPLKYVNDPERTLYSLLRDDHPDPYSRYNSLLRRLVSFERAVRQALGKRSAQN